ncbi:MAG: hypothetical protein QM608_09645 [Caulobacter sp.]
MSLLIALAAAAATFSAPLDLPKTAQVEMVVVKSREDVRDGKPGAPVSGKTVYAKTIEAQGDGYRVTLKPLSTELPKVGSAQDQAKVQAALAGLASRTYVYTADDSLAPVAIEDWPTVVAEMTKAFQAMAGDDPNAAKAMNAAMGLFSRMTPEQAAATMLKEDSLLTVPVNMELEVGKPLAYDDQIASPFGGAPIKAKGAVSVEKIDEARGVGVVRWSRTLDPESTTAMIAKVIETMATQMGPDAQKPEVKAMFAKMKFENTSGCLYEIDLKSGLPLKADCESTTAVTDPSSGQLNGRTERWAITQTLKN